MPVLQRMPDQFQYDVFLSHSAKDKSVVRPLAQRLRKDGLNVWIDARRRPINGSFVQFSFVEERSGNCMCEF